MADSMRCRVDKQLQQRLLGAAVIVALVVIFVPELVKSPVDRTPEPMMLPERSNLPALPERPDPAEGLVFTLPPAQRLSEELPEDPTVEPLAAVEALDPMPLEPIPDAETVIERPEPGVEPEDLPARQEPVAAPPPPAAPPRAAEPPPRPAEPPPPRAAEPPRRETPPPAQRPAPSPPPAQTARAAPPPAPAAEPPLPELRLISRPMAEYQARADEPRWMVQAGSFEALENANQLRDRLRDRQFPATLTQATVNGRRLYRVQIGPHSSRAEGERVRDRLRHETGIDGSLIPVYH